MIIKIFRWNKMFRVGRYLVLNPVCCIACRADCLINTDWQSVCYQAQLGSWGGAVAGAAASHRRPRLFLLRPSATDVRIKCWYHLIGNHHLLVLTMQFKRNREEAPRNWSINNKGPRGKTSSTPLLLCPDCCWDGRTDISITANHLNIEGWVVWQSLFHK